MKTVLGFKAPVVCNSTPGAFNGRPCKGHRRDGIYHRRYVYTRYRGDNTVLPKWWRRFAHDYNHCCDLYAPVWRVRGARREVQNGRYRSIIVTK
jgi:hypothetical protein